MNGLKISSEVSQALQNRKAVVALESTIISHGMPYPQNLETAKRVENVVRQQGAIPATIAIIEGEPCIGLDASQLERIARGGPRVSKVSRRDIGAVMAGRLDGATTVSATMLLAARAGIRVFVTGGIGGVHRGGETSLDISADLTELGRTPVAVVCAGAKSILDIPRTLEYLETQGVPVVGYGTHDFPAFYTSQSGCTVPWRVDSPHEAAGIIAASEHLNLNSGMVIAVPIPAEHAAEGRLVQAAIDTALREVEVKNIQGNKVTPYLLERINELTGGASLKANIELVMNNAKVGAQIAVALSGAVSKL